MYVRMDGWMDAWIDGWMDGQMDVVGGGGEMGCCMVPVGTYAHPASTYAPML